MILDIITHPNEILRAENEEISQEQLKTDEFKRFVFDMAETMRKKDGIGLAAPQVGKNIRMCVINTEKGDLVLINPKITGKSFRKDIDEEGCLSIPGVFGTVKRSKKIKVNALNQKGDKINFTASGLFARVIQHEVDHLRGVLFIDKVVEIKKEK
jgi:peptide deformylase